MSKLPEAVLKSLQEKHSAFIDLRSKLADLTMHEMRIQDQKQQIRVALENASQDLFSLEDSIKEEHGAVRINLTNGELEK